MTQRNQPLRKTHSKTGHEKGFLIKKKERYYQRLVGGGKHETNIQEPDA